MYTKLTPVQNLSKREANVRSWHQLPDTLRFINLKSTFSLIRKNKN